MNSYALPDGRSVRRPARAAATATLVLLAGIAALFVGMIVGAIAAEGVLALAYNYVRENATSAAEAESMAMPFIWASMFARLCVPLGCAGWAVYRVHHKRRIDASPRTRKATIIAAAAPAAVAALYLAVRLGVGF